MTNLSVKRTAYLIGLLSIIFGIIVIIGWNINSKIMQTIILGGTPMRPNSSVGIILCGIALILLSHKTNINKLTIRILALIIFTIGIFSLLVHIFVWKTGIENFLVFNPTSIALPREFKIVPINSAMLFALIGIVIFILTFQIKNRIFVEILSVFILTKSIIVLFGHLTGLNNLVGVNDQPSEIMAISLAIIFITLSLGFIFIIFSPQQLKFNFEERLAAVITIIFVFGIFVFQISISTFNSLSRSVDSVEHTDKVKAKIQSIVLHSLRIQSGARGYVITGKDIFAQPFLESANTIMGEVKNLKNLTSDNPTQQKNVNILLRLISERIELSNHYYNSRKQKGEKAAIDIINREKGRMISDSINIITTMMVDEENLLLKTREYEEHKRTYLAELVTQVNFLIQIILLFSIFFAVRKYLLDKNRTEKKLKEYADEITDLYDNAPAGYHSLDKNGLILSINNTELNWLGYTRDELVGKVKFIDLFEENSKRVFHENFPKFIKSGELVNLEFNVVKKDGTIIPVLLNATSIRDSEGNFIASRSTIFDITDKKKDEEKLKYLNTKLIEHEKQLSLANAKLERRVDERTASLAKSEERFRTTLENLIEGCQIIDHQYRYIFLNDSAAKQGRNPKEKLLDNTMMEMYPGIEMTEMFLKLKTCMDNRVSQKMENEFIYPDGSTNWFYLNMEPVPEGVFIMSTDITDRKKAENELLKLNEELEQKVLQRTEELQNVNKELEAFSYSVSHDLRAPLRHINGFIDLLNMKSSANLDEKGLHYLKVIKDASLQMGQLIDDLLTFSRIGRSSVNKSKINFSHIIQSILEQSKEEIDKRHIKINIGDLPEVEADLNLIRQVWANLISNAIKYTRLKENPEIEIGCQPQKKRYNFFIKDNGAGFSMEYYDKLFGVFQRLHSQEEFEGTGIGLANVKRIIDKHGGKVWAEGKENEGAIFYFSLPYK